MKKKAFITGVTGQDGSYLAELLLENGYEVHGLVRRTSTFNRERIDHLHLRDKNPLILHYGDLTDQSSMLAAISGILPDEIYNLGAQSHVAVSFEEPEYTANSDALGSLRLLEAIRILKLEKKTKYYQASTSELFGGSNDYPQNEETSFAPRSPYAIAKLYAYWITNNYRLSYGLFSSNGILFNHESPRRGENFVTRKISIGVARIHNKLQESISLGNLDSKRDWGYAPEYVRGMWQILQLGFPGDFVLATGETHSVREFVECAFKCIQRDIVWEGQGVEEVGIEKNSGIIRVRIDPKYYRPQDVQLLLGDYTKAKNAFGWEPATKFRELVDIMVTSDIRKEASKCNIIKY